MLCRRFFLKQKWNAMSDSEVGGGLPNASKLSTCMCMCVCVCVCVCERECLCVCVFV
jgi:hypothetical protein